MPSSVLTPAQLDRAAGVLLGQACGDALGVPYEFAPQPLDEHPEMRGGGLGPYEPGEYSDDTQMAVVIAQVAATGADLTSNEALDAIAEGFLDWYGGGATDVGNLTSVVLTGAQVGRGGAASRLRVRAAALQARTGRTAGNGALMRTAPVALAHLEDPQSMAAAARAIAELTHADPLAGDSAVLWCAGIARAVHEGSFDGVRAGLELLPAARRDRWAHWLADAARRAPGEFADNGFTVTALQAAYAAVRQTPIPPDEPHLDRFPCLHLQHALTAAVRVGNDTDTVAAIAGALLGARWGASAVPFGWRRILHGWPRLRARDLIRLAVLITRGGTCDEQGWPAGGRLDYRVPASEPVAHPHDDGVLLGTAGTVAADTDAVVSLCRLGATEVPARGVRSADHLEAWLIDSADLAANPNLAFAVDDAAHAVAALRDEGRRVLLHCVYAQSRTPTVAARYAVLRGVPLDRALADVRAALPYCSPTARLWDAVRQLSQPPA